MLADQTPEHKPQALTGASSAPQHENTAAFQMADNRGAAAIQKKLQNDINNSPAVRESGVHQAMADRYAMRKASQAGLPLQLKTGIESLSGLNMDEVKVHYNSSKPAQLHAHAYAQGNNIHLSVGQEKHLPHEAWHVVQQMRGQVKPTLLMKTGIAVNDDQRLEHEADVMGRNAAAMGGRQTDNGGGATVQKVSFSGHAAMPVQGEFIFPQIEGYDTHFHKTSFQTRVNVMPLVNEEDGGYLASDVWIRQIKISDDRPPTKFGSEGQRSHTVAWTLLRASLRQLNGQRLDKFVAIIDKLTEHSVASERADAKLAAAGLLKSMQAGANVMVTAGRKVSIADWQQEASDLLTLFIHYYQLSEAATYADGRAIGHGESSNMARLQILESSLQENNVISDGDVEVGLNAAFGMVDAKNTLPGEVLGRIVTHWLQSLYLVFPRFMKEYRVGVIGKFAAHFGVKEADVEQLLKNFGDVPFISDAITDHGKNKLNGISVESTEDNFHFAIPEQYQSTFVANVMLKGEAGTQRPLGVRINSDKDAISVSYFSYGKINIERIKVADDRPDTRFGKAQKSHTVAWTFIRKHLINFGGKNLGYLLNFMHDEMAILKEDIDSQNSNTKIKFEASQVAAVLQKAIFDIVDGDKLMPIHQWQSVISELVETYITLYQLSRSATYSSEENPKGHGESQVIKKLDDAHGNLDKMDDANRENSITENLDELIGLAVKLVDAAIGNGTLPPKEWKRAIEHWSRIFGQIYPHLGNHKGFVENVRNSISIVNIEEDALVNFGGKSDKEKLLANIYDRASNEVKDFPGIFEDDVLSRIKTGFDEDGHIPEDFDRWNKAVDAMKIPQKYKNKWAGCLVDYTRKPIRLGASKNKSMAKSEETPSFKKLDSDLRVYLGLVTSEKEKLSEQIAISFIEKACGKFCEHGFAEKILNIINIAISGAISDALTVSSLLKIENQKEWFDIISSMDEKGMEEEDVVDGKELQETKALNYNNIIKAIDARK